MRNSLVLSCGLLLALAGPTARADDKGEADRHFKLGVTLYDEGNFSGALVEFQRANDLSPHPLVLYNLAITYRELHRDDEAIEAFERVLAAAGRLDPKVTATARRELDEVKLRVASVTVTSQPEGAEVIVDGRSLGKTPLPRPLSLGPGTHTIELRKDGRTESRSVTVASGDQTRVAVDLPAETVAVAPAPAELAPSAAVPAPLAIHEEAPREHRLALALSYVTNAAAVAETGAPALGASFAFGRVSAGLDVLFVAFAVVPSVRVRLAGGGLSLHALAAVPVSLTDAGELDVFVAGAAGLGLRARLAPRISLRGEALLSLAPDPYGLTVPVSLGLEVGL